MEQIRTRKSFGNLKTTGGDATQTQLEEFEDFRRRHSRQNREVVMDNAQRKLSLKELQDKISELQLEVLQVKSRNVQLEKQLAKAREAQAGPNANIAMRALDQILGAVPALSALRDVLSNPTEFTTAKKQFAVSSVSLAGPSAPRIIDRGDKNRMGVIEEDWEDEEEPTQASRALPKSVTPTTIPLPPSPISPAFLSPSPKKHKSPKKKPVKRRRESGLMQARQPSPPTQLPSPVAPKSIPIMPPIPASVSAPPLASSSRTPHKASPAVPPTPAQSEAAGDAGGRGRRSRASVVSYKEPSLHKKMRKPDGLSAEDALRVGGARQSLAFDAISPVTSPLPPLLEESASQRSNSSQRSNPSEGGVRRKSIIPRTKSNPMVSQLSSDSDDDELPEVEDMLPIEIEPREPPRTTYTEVAFPPDSSSNPSSSSSSGPEALFSPTPMRPPVSSRHLLQHGPSSTKSTATAPGRPAPSLAASAPSRTAIKPTTKSSRPPSPKLVSGSGRKIHLTSKMAQSTSLGRIATAGPPRGALKDLRDN